MGEDEITCRHGVDIDQVCEACQSDKDMGRGVYEKRKPRVVVAYANAKHGGK